MACPLLLLYNIHKTSTSQQMQNPREDLMCETEINEYGNIHVFPLEKKGCYYCWERFIGCPDHSKELYNNFGGYNMRLHEDIYRDTYCNNNNVGEIEIVFDFGDEIKEKCEDTTS